jgi:hypothetical protein
MLTTEQTVPWKSMSQGNPVSSSRTFGIVATTTPSTSWVRVPSSLSAVRAETRPFVVSRSVTRVPDSTCSGPTASTRASSRRPNPPSR